MSKRLRPTIKGLITHLATEHHTPRQLAAATFVGTVIGSSPFFGLHLLLSVAFGFVLKLNKAVIYAVANISNPFFAPFIIFASYQLGSLVWTGHFQELSVENLQRSPPEVVGFWLSGSLVFGISLGLVLAGLVFMLAKKLQARPQPDHFNEHVNITAHAFLRFGRFAHGYAKGKLKTDPVYRRALDLIPPQSSLLDLGGGQGLLALMHALRSRRAPPTIKVIDYDEKKLLQGQSVAQQLELGVSFVNTDLANPSTARAEVAQIYDAVCLIDVLHYAPSEIQDQLIANAASTVKPGGLLLIRDMDKSQQGRTILNQLQERFSLRLGITKAKKIIPRERASLLSSVAKHGFELSWEPCSGGFLYSNILVIAVRKN